MNQKELTKRFMMISKKPFGLQGFLKTFSASRVDKTMHCDCVVRIKDGGRGKELM